MNIIGQESILRFIDSHNLSNLPRTIMLEGPFGSGRHLLSKYLAEKNNLELIDISDNLNYEYIEFITLKVEPCLYIIDCNKITVKNENAILKFLEEPPKNSFIILITENKHSQLDTIRNRCYCLTLQTYNQEQLKLFLTPGTPESVLLICRTPGEILGLQEVSIDDLFALCNKIFDRIHDASFANTLTLVNNLAFKDEKDKYNVMLFMRAMVFIATDRVMKNLPYCYSDYALTQDYFTRFNVKNVDKKYLFENYLIVLKKSRGAKS